VNKFFSCDVLNYIEENSKYAKLLKARFINKEKYTNNLSMIKQGLAILGISSTPIKVFENKHSFIIWLGRRLTEYEGYELPLYIGHKKANIPVPDALLEKCPKSIVKLIEKVDERRYLKDFIKELKNAYFTPEIFLCIHKSIVNARVEVLFPDLLADIERQRFTSIDDAFEKIPRTYLNYLSQVSLTKLTKKISSMLREVSSKMEQELKNIDLYSLRLEEQLQELYLEADKGLKDIVENDLRKGYNINTITKKVSNLFSRLDRLFLGNIYHLKDYDKRRGEIKKFLKQGEDLKYNAKEKILARNIEICEIFNDYMFFHKFGPPMREEDKMFTKAITTEFEGLHRQKNRGLSLLDRFEKRGLLSVELDFESIKDTYNSFIKRVIIPHYVAQCLLDLVYCLPPSEDDPQRLVDDCVNLRILSLEGKSILKLKKEERDYPEEIKKFVEMFHKCITILVYDIRGSSYMGIKLHDAAKEQRIKYKFAKEMADIVKKYEGFLLKDTGDGGLVWFAENSMTLYNQLYTESVTGRGIKLRSSIFSGAEFDLIPAFDAAKRAVLCARDMVQRAEEFIRANFMHYREWFADVAERTLELDGITYALLPPEFKSLFRIGIGIASGVPHKDVVFSANSYGDPDLVGPIISDAHLYSFERRPGRSVIICDLQTLINLILNIDNFEYPVDEKNFEQHIKIISDLRKGNHGYNLSDLKISVIPKGIHYLGELNKSKAVAGAEISDVYLDEKYLYNQQKKKIKLIYEIINI